MLPSDYKNYQSLPVLYLSSQFHTLKDAKFGGHCNVISHSSIKHSRQAEMETLIWFQAHWVCLFLSLFNRPYIWPFLSHFNNLCPSRLCLVHWTITLTQAEFGCLIPVCSAELETRWHTVCIIMNTAPFSHVWDKGLFAARWTESGFILIDMALLHINTCVCVNLLILIWDHGQCQGLRYGGNTKDKEW